MPLAPLPMAHLEHAGIARPPDAAGAARPMLATEDSGSESEAAAASVAQRGCEPSRATGRPRHQPPEATRTEPPPTAPERRAAHGRTTAGRARYARRTGLGEPGLGQSKAARGFRRVLRRGLDNMRGAWRLVWVPQNLRKLWRDARAPRTVYPHAMGP